MGLTGVRRVLLKCNSSNKYSWNPSIYILNVYINLSLYPSLSFSVSVSLSLAFMYVCTCVYLLGIDTDTLQ